MFIAGLVVAILGLVIGLIPFIGWLAVPLNIGAVIVGGVGLKKKLQIAKNEYQLAVACLILGAIPLVLKIFSVSSLMSIAR